MHTEALSFVREFAEGREFQRVVEFGSLDINGSVRSLFVTGEYRGIDLQDGPGVDEIADALTYSTQPVDCVICCEVLEHEIDVPGMVQSAHANLKEGGWFVVTCATYHRAPHSAVDGGPLRPDEYYGNVDPAHLKHCLIEEGFDVDSMEIHQSRGDLYVIAHKPLFDSMARRVRNYEGPGRYRHYKGGEYEVLGLALHESLLYRLVIYRPLTPGSKLDGTPVTFWARPADDFDAWVEIEPTNWVPRFERAD